MRSNYSHFLTGSLVLGAALAIFVLTPSANNVSSAASSTTPAAVSSASGAISLGSISLSVNKALADNGWPTLPPNCPPPSCTLSVSPSSAQLGQSVVLTWSSQYATSGYLHEYNNYFPTAGGQVTLTNAQATHTYTATFTGPGGTVDCSTTLTVIQPQPVPAPTCTLSVSPATIQLGQKFRLTWASTDATGGSISDVGQLADPNGYVTITHQTVSETFNGVFQGPGGTAHCHATVTVATPPPPPPPPAPAPTCVINASPTIITQQGQNITLNWSAQNATVGSITNIGSVGSTGSVTVNPTQTTSYNGTFQGPGGSVNCNVKIVVVINNPPPVPSAPACTLTASPSSIQPGQLVTLSWNSQNTTSGSITGLGSVGASGSQAVYPTQSTSYTGTFTGTNGQTVNCYASVNVVPVTPVSNTPQCTLTASPNVINSGAPVTLYWTSQYATYGTITTLGSVNLSGSQTMYPNQSTVYEGTFSGPNGSVNCFVTVNVNPIYMTPVQQPPYVSLSQAPYTGLDLGPWGTALYWAFLLAWCAFAAYLVAVKRIQNKLFNYVLGAYYGDTASQDARILSMNPEQGSEAAASIEAPAHKATNDHTDSFVLSQVRR